MSLWEYALCTTEEVWDYLNIPEAEKNEFEPQMEGWINGASFILEQHLNRPIKARQFNVYQDGTGTKTLLLDYYPLIKMHSITVQTFDLVSTYTISPVREDGEVVINPVSGVMSLLPFAQIGHWFRGKQNIHLVYEAGFSGYALAPFQIAVKELVQVYWKDMGTNPRIQQLNENVGNAYFTGRFDPKKLSHQTQMAVHAFQRVEV